MSLRGKEGYTFVAPGLNVFTSYAIIQITYYKKIYAAAR